MVVGDILRLNACNYPRKVGVVFGQKRFTWLEVNERVNRLANALVGLGLARGERLAIVSNNCNEFVETYFAAAKAGLVVVPMNVRLAAPEMTYILNQAGAKALVVQAPFAATMRSIAADVETLHTIIGFGPDHNCRQDYDALLEKASVRDPNVPVDENDLFVLFFTSGTTGRPKGAMLSHRNNIMAAWVHSSEYRYTPKSIVHSIPPSFFTGGWHASLVSGSLRASTLVIDNFDPATVLDTMEREQITHTALVPTLLNMIVNDPSFPRRRYQLLRTSVIAGSPVHPSLLLSAENVFGKTWVIPFGMTETCATGCILRQEQATYEGEKVSTLSSVGMAEAGMSVRVTDDDGQPIQPGSGKVGEILLKGPTVMMGYWNSPEVTAEVLEPDGWFHTGDLVRVDEEGLVYVVDRKKDMIISGGINIFSREIEEVLFKHPAVLNAAVIGVPDDRWGEAVMAMIVPKPGAQPTKDEITEYCKQHLASYKKPAHVEFVASLPTTATGKILKRDLRKPYWEGRERKVQ